MSQMIARKGLVLDGKRYEPGERVPVDKVDHELRRKLIDQKRVIPDAVRGEPKKGG